MYIPIHYVKIQVMYVRTVDRLLNDRWLLVNFLLWVGGEIRSFKEENIK